MPPSPASRARPILITFGALLALALLAISLRFIPGPPTANTTTPSPPPPEANLSDLLRRDGLLHQRDASNPFTGFVVEHYPDGTLKSRSAVRNGRLDGPSEGWFTNGTLQVREHFRDGTAHGPRTRWFPNGTRASEATLSNGQITGIFRRWNDDATLAEEIHMLDGQPHGVARSFFPSGSIKTEALMEHGRMIEQTMWKDGEKQPAPAGTAAPDAPQPQP